MLKLWNGLYWPGNIGISKWPSKLDGNQERRFVRRMKFNKTILWDTLGDSMRQEGRWLEVKGQVGSSRTMVLWLWGYKRSMLLLVKSSNQYVFWVILVWNSNQQPLHHYSEVISTWCFDIKKKVKLSSYSTYVIS